MSVMKKVVGGAHNLIIFLCLVAALLVALAAPGTVLVLKLLVPEWFSVAVVVIAVVPTHKDTWIPQFAPSLSVFSPRPPPIQ
jgi:uncharacterized membrane protein YkvI